MEILRIAPGLVAVHAARLIMVCALKPSGRVAVRDLANGEVSEIAVGELSAPAATIRENDATRLHADVAREPDPVSHCGASRTAPFVAALVREGPLRLAVEQTSAVSSITARLLGVEFD